MWPGPYGDRGSRKYLLASPDQSLRRLGLEYVDIFYSHRADPDTPTESRPDRGRAKMTRSRSGSCPPRTLTACQGLADLARAPGQTPPQMAIAWVLRDRRATSALVGVSSVAQLEANVAALDNTSFTDAEMQASDYYAVDAGIDLWEGSHRS